MSNYLIELSVIHIALILGYWFFLRKEQQYAKMRFFLIGSTLLALTVPLLKLPKLFSSQEPIATLTMEAISLDATAIAPVVETSIWTTDLLIWIYLAISAFFLFKFLSGVFYLIWLERRSSLEKLGDLNIRKAHDIKGSFTFFNWIFLSADIDPGQHDYVVILKHERAHASLGHTYDLIFLELFKVCFWWLPTAWIIIKETKKIHEYQADATAIKSCDVDRYSSILISSTLKTNGLSLPATKKPSAALASSFHDGFILKRLTAMKQQAKNVNPWKLAALSALCASLFIVFACSEEMDRDIKEMGSNSNMIDVPADDDISSVKELQDLDPNLIHSVSVDKINRAIYVALKKDGANFDYLSEKSKMDGEIFTVVERQPEYQDGIQGFRSYIVNEMRYPLAARQAGVEGRVDVQFVIEKDGSLSEVKAIKGIGAGCDEEAVRVVQSMPPFTPGTQNGKPVRVRMVVPITFKLNEGKTNPDNSTQGIVIIEEVQPRYEKFKVDADYANGEWSGTVYDAGGKGLPGVNIVVMGTSHGTVSNTDGAFKLKADQSNELSLSFIGYESVRLRN